MKTWIASAALTCTLAGSADAGTEKGLRVLVSGGFHPLTEGAGFNLGGGVGFAVNPNISILGDIEYSSLPYVITRFGNSGTSETRGGAIFYATVNVKLGASSLRRVAPYGLVGAGLGWTDPYEKGSFADRPVGRSSGSTFVMGGGASFRVSPRAQLYAEYRIAILSVSIDGDFDTPLKFGVEFGF